MSIRLDWPCLEAGEEFVFPCGISVFFPAYNDAPSLPALLARTFETLRRHAIDYEVIVVNDGSEDDTAAVLAELRDRYAPHLRVITHERNRGYGGALRSGFASCTKEFVFYTDGDGQYDPGELVTLLRKVTPRTGLVNGYKIARNDPWRRVAIGWAYNRFARFLFSVKLRDIDCDFRLIRRGILDQIELGSTSGTICVELVRKIELLAPEVAEAPVHHYPRRHGSSQFFRVRSLATTFSQLWRLYGQLVLPRGSGAAPVIPADSSPERSRYPWPAESAAAPSTSPDSSGPGRRTEYVGSKKEG
jgi:glycosyltransferase involved in cell wall biosynthesis